MRQAGGVAFPVGQGGRLQAGDDQAVAQEGAVVWFVNDEHAGKDRLQGRAQRVHQTVVVGGARNVDRYHPIGRQMGAHRAEEFNRGQMKRNVRRTVCVYRNHVVARSGVLQKVTAILGHDMQIRLVHAEPAAPHGDDGRVKLRAIHGQGAVDLRVEGGNGAAGQPDQRQPLHIGRRARRWAEERRQ